MSEENGKLFINSLKRSIDNVEVYSPTGKYGKNELNVAKTKKEKLEKLLLATPSNPDEILEYVFFCQSINGQINSRILNRVESLLDRAMIDYPENDKIKNANLIFIKMQKKVKQAKTKIALQRSWRIALILIGIGGYIWGYTTDWAVGWKIVWGIFALIPVIILIWYAGEGLSDIKFEEKYGSNDCPF